MSILKSIFAPFAHAEVRRSAYLLLIFLIAAIDGCFFPRERFSLIFDHVQGSRSRLEERNPRRSGELEDRIALYAEEVILGPTSVDYERLFVRGTKLSSVLVRARRLYLNLSAEAALPIGEFRDQKRSIDLLLTGLERNFRTLDSVTIYINGILPYDYAISGEQ